MQEIKKGRVKGKNFSTFGWQGISFLHPKEWNISKLSKEYNRGEVFLDDGFIVRIELHWYTPPSSFSLERIISNHIKTIEKETKRRKLPFCIERKVNPPLEKIFTKDRNGEFFILESDYRAFCMVWYCKVCGRVLLMRIYSKKEEDIRGIVKKIYGSLKDHPTDDKVSWGLYDLFFRTQKDYKLSDYFLKSGYLKLTFNKEKDRLIIERWALGNLLLKERDLREWFCETHPDYNRYLSDVSLPARAPSLKLWSVSDQTSFLAGGKEKGKHIEFTFDTVAREKISMFTPFRDSTSTESKALDKTLKPKNITKISSQLYRNFKRHFLSLTGFTRRTIIGKVWYCKKTNRIFILLSISPKRKLSVLDELYKDVACCR